MLDPDFRRLYSECFAAPPDHDLEGAVGTTFSLDLDSLLFAMFCLTTSGVEDPEAVSNPVAVLEAIHRTSERMTVFAHVGETNAPARPRALYALLERCVVPARGRGGAIFHPKLWVLRYRSRSDGSALVRVVVLSRNLTRSRAWDQLVCLEGTPAGAVLEENRELVALMRALPSFVVQGQMPSEARLTALEGLAQAVERTRFAAPPPFTGVARFVALGVSAERRFEPPAGERIFAMAPFVSTDALAGLRGGAQRAELVARAEELAKCGAEAVGAWETFVLDDGASLEADGAESVIESDTADAAPEGLHAKVLAVESGQQVTWWLGSANLTDPVRAGSSVELMVQLTGKVASAGVDVFLDAGFRSLLVKYEHRALVPDAAEGSRSSVDRMKRQLCAASLALHCRPERAAWVVALAGDLPAAVEGVGVTCRPVTLASYREIGVRDGAGPLEFSGLSAEAVTAFLVFRVVTGTGEARFEHEFTLKLPISGVPEDRDARVARAIVKDRAAFMAYLRCLFEELAFGAEGGAAEHAAEGEGADGAMATLTAGLLEPMLRTVHRDPERLRGLRALLEQCESATEATVIPDEFRAVWAAVEPFLPGHARAAE